jgi:glutathionyl-hydroquinone reductase
MDLSDITYVQALKSNMHTVFDSPSGKEVMEYLEQICQWYPTMYDTNDTNAIIARDANRRVLGTIKTILKLSPEQIVSLALGEYAF